MEYVTLSLSMVGGFKKSEYKTFANYFIIINITLLKHKQKKVW